MKIIKVLLLIFSFSINATDLTIFGFPIISDGLGSIPFRFVHILKDVCSINFVNTRPHFPQNFDGATQECKRILLAPFTEIGTISIMTDALPWGNNAIKGLVSKSQLKIAYSMFETDQIPSSWVQILNKNFDYVIVPDEFLIDVYLSSGVTIPIFTLPLPMDLEPYLRQQKKTMPRNTFTFGVSASFTLRKNLELLIESFSEEFRYDKRVFLKLHGRYASKKLYQRLLNKIRQLNLTNVTIINKVFSTHEYMQFLRSLDCYVLLTKGEGYSLSPRQAMALGIPCILTNNTAQKTLCDSGYVQCVSSDIKEPAVYEDKELSVGNLFSCKKEDVRQALRFVYENYYDCAIKAENGRKWVERYDYQELTAYYKSIIRPNQIIFGSTNEITQGAFITNDRKLYEKMKTLFR